MTNPRSKAIVGSDGLINFNPQSKSNLKTSSSLAPALQAQRIGVMAEHKSFLTGLSIERLRLLRKIVRTTFYKHFPKNRELPDHEVDRIIESKGADLMRRMEEMAYETGAAVVFGDQ